MNLQRRKHIRLKGYDYSQNGCYFVTICAYDRNPILGEIIIDKDSAGQESTGQEQSPCPTMRLSAIGEVVYSQWFGLTERYKNVELDNFIVMPNHIHGIITIKNVPDIPRVSVSDVLCAYKSITTKICNQNDNVKGQKIWQFRFYDHIIRNEKEYLAIYEYIENNYLLWAEDEYYR